MSRPSEHLPAVYRDRGLGSFADAAAVVLDELAEELAGVADVLDPARTPEAFLPWLSGWLALALPPTVSDAVRRRVLADTAWLHRRRGTAPGLRRLLELVLAPVVEGAVVVRVDDGVGPAHLFQVEIELTAIDRRRHLDVRRLADLVVDRERPAHTVYGLKIVAPPVRLGSRNRPDQPRLMIGPSTIYLATPRGTP